ncbi:MAG: hypothetical protein QOD89_83 [Bradyrhizobium sp.]|nr:hypothetical protein [Bradyrhizobium sp.]
MQGDLPAVLAGPAFDKPIRNQPVHEPDRSRMRHAEDSPEPVVTDGAIPNDNERGRGFAGAAYDLVGALLDLIHHGERKRTQ